MTTPSVASVLDASAIDKELSDALLRQWDGACSHLGSGFCVRFQPELHALLRTAMWQFSVGSGVPTPGQAMQGLSYSAAPAGAVGSAIGPVLQPPPPRGGAPPALRRWQRAGHFLLAVALPWAWARAAHLATAPDHPERLRWWRAMQRAEGLLQLLSLLCALRMLCSARAPSLPMALLGMHLVQTATTRYAADFEFMNQEVRKRA